MHGAQEIKQTSYQKKEEAKNRFEKRSSNSVDAESFIELPQILMQKTFRVTSRLTKPKIKCDLLHKYPSMHKNSIL